MTEVTRPNPVWIKVAGTDHLLVDVAAQVEDVGAGVGEAVREERRGRRLQRLRLHQLAETAEVKLVVGVVQVVSAEVTRTRTSIAPSEYVSFLARSDSAARLAILSE